MMAKSFFQLREWCSRQCNTCTYTTERPQMCGGSFRGSRASVHYSSPPPPSVPVSPFHSLYNTALMPTSVRSISIYDVLSRPNTCPPSTSLLSGLPSPSFLSPVTKTQSFWPFFCIHDLKKDPLYPQLRENAFDQFVTSPCALSSVVFHLIGFHLAFKQSIKKSE